MRKKQRVDNAALIEQYGSFRSAISASTLAAHKGAASAEIQATIDRLKALYGIFTAESGTNTRVQLSDALSLLDTTQLAALNAQNIKLGGSGVALDPNDFVDKVAKFMDPYATDDDQTRGEPRFNAFNWLALGALYLEVSAKPIVGEYLYGPLDTERRRQGARAARVADDTHHVTALTAQNVAAADIDHDHEQNTAHMVKDVYNRFVEAAHGGRVNFYRFFIDPQSFGQSVENLFFTSFLIKDGKLQLSLDAEGVPTIGVPADDADDDDDDVDDTTSHYIATFSYKSWQRMIAEHDITSSFLGHRTEPDDNGEDAVKHRVAPR